MNRHPKFPKTVAAAALLLAEHFGLAVFPAPPGTKRSYKSMKYCGGRRWGATNDPAQVARDWRRWPRANLGLPCGPENGIFVVECDTKAGHGVDGVKSLRALERKHGRLPKTLVAISPAGSLHYYFRWPADPKILIRNSASKIAPGVDVRGARGMVLAPPSIKPGVGVYRYLNWGTPCAEAPAWLLRLVAVKKTRRRKPASGKPVDSANVDLIAAALNVIPAESYQIWFEVGCALSFELGDAGFALFDAWSATSRKYEAKQCAAKWRECAKIFTYTIGTIIHHANAESPGWRVIYETRRLVATCSLRTPK
jgi:bifunctional DNA primase/polymerase-like protein/primase-like protein